MPLDDTNPRGPAPDARRTTRRLATAVVLAAMVLTVLAVGWKLPFAGTAALLVVFLGGLWVALRWLRGAFSGLH